MSERTAGVAVDAMYINDLEDGEFGWEMMALLEALDFEYERWCRVLGLDPDNDRVEAGYKVIHDEYAWTWKEMGTAEFAKKITPLADKWRRILDQKKVLV